jgi:alginate O-acetyltransferase complex protein AlgJ
MHISCSESAAAINSRRAMLKAAGLLATAGFAPPTLAAPASLTVEGKKGWLFPIWDVMARVEPAQLRAVTQVYAEAMTAMRGAGIAVIFGLVPSKSRTYRQYLPDGTRLNADIDKRYPQVVADLARTGATLPDLDAAFQAARASQPLYFRTDTHWTPIGAELAAATLAARMQPGLPPSPRPGLRLAPATETLHATGDLARMLPANERDKYPAEKYLHREVLASTGTNALLEDDNADVVVVGNSFAQPRYGFAASLSNRLNRPVALAWRPNTYGTFFTLLEYLKSPVFRQSRPKALLWLNLEIDLQNLPNSSSWGPNAMSTQTFLAELHQALRA